MQQRIIKRIGNDVFVNLPIYEKDGSNFNPTGATMRFELRNSNAEAIPITDYRFENGNRLCFWVLAREFKAYGWYDFVGEIKRADSSVKGGTATYTFDIRKLIRIVSYSEWITDNEATAGIFGMLDMYALSAYHSYVRTTSDDPIMTEKEWVQTLKLRYEDLTDTQLRELIAEVVESIPNQDVGFIIKEGDTVTATDKNVFSALRVIKEITQRIQSSFANLFDSLKDKFLRKDVEDIAAKKITFSEGLNSKLPAELEKGFTTGDYGVNEDGDAILKEIIAQKITSAERADLKKGFKTGDWGLDETGQFGARRIIGSEAVFGDVTLQGAMRSPTFNPGMLGSGFFFGRTDSGKILLELDDLNVRGTMTIDELIIHKVSQVGGAFLFSPAGGEVESIYETGTYWQLTLKDKKNIFFKPYDQILCQNFSENRKKRYWRLCTYVDYDSGYIILSKTDAEALSGVPEIGDEIITFGNRNDTKRQNAILISSYGDFGAYQQFFSGVDSYDLTGKIDIQLGHEIDITADKLEIRGRDGKKTRVPRERGEWVSGETYYYYDRVRHNGAFWLCMMMQTAAAPSDKSPEWVKETNVRVGGVNLLREYAIQFDFKYWGGHTAQENVNYIMVDIDAVKANVKYMNVSPSLISWVFPEYEALISVRSNVNWTNF